MADGVGVDDLAEATRLKLKSFKRAGDELFLTWRAVGRALRSKL